MSLLHNREEALREIRNMPEQCFTDGVLLDVPRRRRREQAMGTRPMTIKWPVEQKKRFGKQYDRYVSICTKDLALEIMLKLLEEPSDELIKSWVEG
jgi:hypothetical protein